MLGDIYPTVIARHASQQDCETATKITPTIYLNKDESTFVIVGWCYIASLPKCCYLLCEW